MRDDHTIERLEDEPEPYEPPEITDYGTLSELTLGGSGAMNDSLLMGAS